MRRLSIPTIHCSTVIFPPTSPIWTSRRRFHLLDQHKYNGGALRTHLDLQVPHEIDVLLSNYPQVDPDLRSELPLETLASPSLRLSTRVEPRLARLDQVELRPVLLWQLPSTSRATTVMRMTLLSWALLGL